MPNINSQFNNYLRDDLSNNKPRWKQWVEKNAKPKVFKFPEPHSMPTRFQKPGPMTENDWQRFNKWINDNMTKKSLNKDKVKGPMKKQPLPKQFQKRLFELSIPKHKREKYNLSTSQHYTFSPTTNFARNQMNDAVKNGSPLKSVIFPKWWFHEESEMNFWRNMRFSVSRKALQYKISNRIENLAKPRQFPIKPHCHIPEPVVFEPVERVRMTNEQWNEHRKRLAYLSDSNYKNTRTDKVLNKIKPQEKIKQELPLSYGYMRIHSY